MAHVLDLDRGDVVDQLHRPVHRIGIEPVLERGRRPAGEERRTDDPVGPGDRLAPRIQSRGDPVVVVGPVDVVLDIFLAGPDDLDRPLDLLGDADGLGHVVMLEPPAEPAAQQVVVHHDFLQRQAGDLGRGRLGSALHLRAGPHLAPILPHVDGAAQRLHGGVRQERRLVDRFDLSGRSADRRRRVAFLPGHHARLL